MPIEFPPSLKQHLLLGDTEGPLTMAVESETLKGAPLLWLKGRSQHRTYTGVLHLENDDDLDTFETWYRDTLNYGTRKFRWHRSGRDGEEVLEMQFSGTQHYSKSAPSMVGYRLTLNLMILRQVA